MTQDSREVRVNSGDKIFPQVSVTTLCIRGTNPKNRCSRNSPEVDKTTSNMLL